MIDASGPGTEPPGPSGAASGIASAAASVSSDAEQAGSAAPVAGDAPPAEVAPAEVPATGDPRVDDALSRLAEVDGLPLAEQVEVYTDIHRRLAAVLADPDSRG